MGLAESILDAIEREERGEEEEDQVEELVQMALDNSQKYRRSSEDIYQLYIDNGRIYLGHQEVDENLNNIYRLTGYKGKIREPADVLFWSELHSRLPYLNRGIIQVSDNLFWDINNGEIIKKEKLYAKSNKPK